ncbi:MAG: 3-dehydroquinate synthase [Actinobacteria bacterium]|nr:3-dehydroquinate synthase [Actinomycetota bacterium]
MSDVVIPVRAERAYDVVIGRGLLSHLPGMVAGSARVAIIHPGALLVSAEGVRDDLRDCGIEVTLIEVPEAEDAKTAEVAAFCWSVLGTAGFTRSDTVVGLGGGATTDLAGFVAATWLRGIRVVQIPTTLLGMVDAAVGGKTGINTDAGKNLVGCFWSPAGVLCDMNALGTLPRNDLLAGMAEVVKIGFVADPSILDDVEQNPFGSTDVVGDLLADLVRRAVQVKADVVGADFRETSATAGDGSIGREVLNYGHTFGHAVERRERYRWRHGAAVSVGMMYVAELAALGGRLSEKDVDRHRSVLTSLGLPTTYAPGHWDELYSSMAVDKKSRGSLLRFVVLQGIGHPMVLEGPDPALLAAAYASISDSSA